MTRDEAVAFLERKRAMVEQLGAVTRGTSGYSRQVGQQHRDHAESIRVVLDIVATVPRERTQAEEVANPRCGCPTETARRVIVEYGTCTKGGCPYGGDI
jgi:hypothetical protein